MQVGYLKMQAGCEIKNMLSDPRIHCIIEQKVTRQCRGPSNGFFAQ